MYCAKCGKALKEGQRFCGKCGTELRENFDFSEQQAEVLKENHGELRRFWLCGIAVAVVLIVVIGLLFYLLKDDEDGGSSGKSYKKTVAHFVQAIEEQDAELYGEITADGWKNYMADAWSYDEEDFAETFEETVEYYYYKYVHDCGDHIRNSLEITDTYEPTEGELAELIRELEKAYDYEEGSVTNAMLVSFVWEIEGDEESCTVTFDKMLLIKENGRWKKIRGAISTDWCEQ